MEGWCEEKDGGRRQGIDGHQSIGTWPAQPSAEETSPYLRPYFKSLSSREHHREAGEAPVCVSPSQLELQTRNSPQFGGSCREFQQLLSLRLRFLWASLQAPSSHFLCFFLVPFTRLPSEAVLNVTAP